MMLYSKPFLDEQFDKLEQLPISIWVIGTTDMAKERKKILLQMASNGEPRPVKKDNEKLSKAFWDYVNKNEKSYDEKFVQEIKKLAPNWFIKEKDSSRKKKLIIQLARNNKDIKGRLRISFKTYTSKNHLAYDKEFDVMIRKIAPKRWFETPSILLERKKQEFITYAKSGGKRPDKKSKFYTIFINYITPHRLVLNKYSYYDKKLHKQIQGLRPDWFEDASEKIKNEIIDIAVSGEKRPSRSTSLGVYLRNRIIIDPTFFNKLKKLRPDWFR